MLNELKPDMYYVITVSCGPKGVAQACDVGNQANAAVHVLKHVRDRLALHTPWGPTKLSALAGLPASRALQPPHCAPPGGVLDKQRGRSILELVIRHVAGGCTDAQVSCRAVGSCAGLQGGRMPQDMLCQGFTLH